VTFNLLASAHKALDAAVTRQAAEPYSSLFGGSLITRRAPDPEDVFWENLQFTDEEIFFRSSIANVIIFLLCILGSAILFGTNLTTTNEYVTGSLSDEVATSFIVSLA
jgi:hypothetical protein